MAKPYETYDTSQGYGNPEAWRSAFNNVLGLTSTEEAYSILGVSKSASLDEIKKAYRSLAFRYHPDKLPNSNKFEKIGIAYKILTTTKKPIINIVTKTNVPTQSIYSPQLLNKIENIEYYLADPLYCAQEKFDGRRRILHFENNKTTSINKKGLIIDCKPIFDLSCKQLAQKLSKHEFTLDGEEINDIFYHFDILSLNNQSLQNYTYSDKIKLCSTEILAIKPIYTAYTEQEKRILYNDLKQNNKEGIVFKLLLGTHKDGYSDEQVKFKFFDTASVIVITKNIKNSVEVAVIDNNNNLISVGNVTCLGKIKPSIGQIIEVKYLYAYLGGSLYQPNFLYIRDDCTKNDCLLSKLKFKSTI